MNTHSLRIVALLGLGLLTAACGKSSPPARSAVAVTDDDARMNAAMAMARARVDEFVTVLQAPNRRHTNFSVKMEVVDQGQSEHVWLSDVTYDGTAFHGKLNNEPEHVSNVKLGQALSVPRADISDWMYVDGNKLIGGFTIRALRDAMPAAERAEFDQSVPFVIQ